METIPVWAAGVACLVCLLLGVAGTHSAYRCGVNDGFMFTKDPTCPGYRKAGRILRSYGIIASEEQAGSKPLDGPAPR